MGAARILVVDDEKVVRWSLERDLSACGFEVTAFETGEEAIEELGRASYDLLLLDVRLPGVSGLEALRRVREARPELPVIMISAFPAVDAAVASLKLGAYDYITKPFDFEELRMTIQRALDGSSMRRETGPLRTRDVGRFSLESIVGNSPAMESVRQMVQKLATSQATTILLQGESGTGKDLVARVIHCLSDRAHRPFVAINCPALPETLLESELMGHAKGAFTDAKFEKRGLFEIADGGTILLDEIGDMPLAMQGKILRIIEEKSFRRIGGVRSISVDVRVIASTNRNLSELVRRDRFRSDLFFRLNVVPVVLPPLRTHREDIPLLVSHFIAQFSAELRCSIKGFAPAAMDALVAYDWPGNVRELRNVVERATILYRDEEIGPEQLPAEIRERRAPEPEQPLPGFRLPPGGIALHELEAALVRQALEASAGNQTRAAQLLQISRDALRSRMKKYKVEISEPRASEP